ncbi:MFS transporter-like protein [Lophiostoma macrostomum CBS 122681]|uniref:MFS transporter-like protein n=1 Tax=Lophiostoma macrostomum CBS 122681 TaxID=1314788 RepID=A0A6A6TRL4_9PLEO|nr:MFS transporter-like protein [Lophiostoma macrostomum CBS 122681]
MPISSRPDSTSETSPLLSSSVTPGLHPETTSDNRLNHNGLATHRSHASLELRLRIAAAMFSFLILGLLTSSLGVMLQPLSIYYHLTDIHAALIFIFGPIGYIFAAQSNTFIHTKFGQRGIAILGPVFHVLSTLALGLHPPFPMILVGLSVQAVGIGLLDGSWCAWAGSMKSANTVSGMLHGSFSAGAMLGPFSASAMMERGCSWYQWYQVLLGASVIELALLTFAFRHANASQYRVEKLSSSLSTSTDHSKTIFKYRAIWASAAYFLAYVGTETAISGWIVSFMRRSRHVSPYLAGLSSSGFWGGMAVGRLTLGAVTDRIGVRKATAGYFLLTIVFEVLFAIARVPAVSMVFMTLLGLFSGPLFPSGVVVLTRLLPAELHVPAVSLVASMGQIGAAVLPFGIGAVVQRLGIGVFQFALPVFSAVSLGLWLVFCMLKGDGGGRGDEGLEED